MADPTDKMESIINLCKRARVRLPVLRHLRWLQRLLRLRPLGVELKNNIKQAWWQDFVHRRDDIVGLGFLHHPPPDHLEGLGHIDNFTDPLVDCKESKMRYRADQLFFAPVRVAGETIGYVSVLEDETMQAKAEELAHELKRKLAKQGALEPLVPQGLHRGEARGARPHPVARHRQASARSRRPARST
jgi:glycyl-tRNA synthetase